ncbi:C2 domain-containing protein [Thecamonas trahens ATCC 50062]|uniref:C2 domain-containing protein n=1 Tax=Thecamonas trahens ATCC 50062 TaxID=461836 RepID=A0A0L0D5R5_THETB|nr:C2 domain-containing protein [Thecamonas trahens ATCC 50062]KNC47712.1 C2 domain-containing protein [Thecamonas trahens ATCC 50062]|eukprot:XP_013759194.1 C2 domain-containing protein [Thecamonas trahens ATCC 50062]
MALLSQVPSVTATFKFTLTDSLTAVVSNEATATVTILNNAHATTASYAIVEDTRTRVVLAGTDDVSAAALSFRIVQLPAAGTLYFAGTDIPVSAGDMVPVADAGAVDYQPGADFVGVDILKFTATSAVSLAESVPAVASFNVSNVNDAPRPQNARVEFFALDLNSTFALPVVEVDGDVITVSVTAIPQASIVALSQTASAGGADITAMPTIVTDALRRVVAHAVAPTQSSTQGYAAEITFTAVDPYGLVGTPAVVTVFVKHSFFAANVTATTAEDTPTTVSLATQDYFGRAYAVYLRSLPDPATVGTLRLVGSTEAITQAQLPLVLTPATAGTAVTLIEFVPARDAVVPLTSFEYEIRDTEGRGEVVVGTVFVSTTAVPDPPRVELTNPSETLEIADGAVLEITTLVVAEVDDPNAIVSVNVTAVGTGLVAGSGPLDSVTFAKTLTLSGTSAEIAAQLLAPLRFKSGPEQRVREATAFEVQVSAQAQGEESKLSLFVNVLPVPDPSGVSLDGSLVAAVAAAACTALLFGAVGAFILYRRQESEPKLPPPPQFTPFIYDENRLVSSAEATGVRAPVSMTTEFTELVVARGQGLVYALFEVSAEADIDDVCERLVFVYEGHGRASAPDLVACIAQREIQMAASSVTLFRSNSRACKLYSVYAKVVGLPYLYATLGPLFVQLVEQDGSIEVAPEKVRKSKSGSVDVTVNKWRLLVVAQKFFKAITESVDAVPYELRQLAQTLWHEMGKPSAFPERRSIALGTFFFIRFICPAIAQPEAYGLVREVPSSDLRRLLVLVAKTLQNLANGTMFVEKELDAMNVFIDSNQEKMGNFLAAVAGTGGGAVGTGVPVPAPVYDASVAWLYAHTQALHADLHLLLSGVQVEGARELDQALIRVLPRAPTMSV